MNSLFFPPGRSPDYAEAVALQVPFEVVSLTPRSCFVYSFYFFHHSHCRYLAPSFSVLVTVVLVRTLSLVLSHHLETGAASRSNAAECLLHRLVVFKENVFLSLKAMASLLLLLGCSRTFFSSVSSESRTGGPAHEKQSITHNLCATNLERSRLTQTRTNMLQVAEAALADGHWWNKEVFEALRQITSVLTTDELQDVQVMFACACSRRYLLLRHRNTE